MSDNIETVPDDGPVLDESGHFHAVDAPIDISHYAWEDWFTFVVFWLLALDVFYQFFTRYVLQDSAAWTEEIARYLLIVIVFVGAVDGRAPQHAHPRRVPVPLPPGPRGARAVDVGRRRPRRVLRVLRRTCASC